MDRRAFLRASITGGVGVLAGCTGGTSESDPAPTTSTPGAEPASFRVDFVDETGTLGHVADTYSTENDFDAAVNEYTEADWQAFEENDIDQKDNRKGGGVWNDGNIADHLDEIQPFVEYTMGMRDDLPGFTPEDVTDSTGTTPLQIRQSDLDWAEKLAWGTGFGIQHNLPKVDSGIEGASTVLPGIEYFARDLLNRGDEIETVAMMTAEPNTGTSGFTHLTGFMSYTHSNGDFTHKYVEGTIGGGTPPVFNSVIRRPQDSIYADPDVHEAASPFQYSKARSLIEDGNLEAESDRPGKAYLSGSLMSTLWSYVDVSGLGSEVDFDEEHAEVVENWNQIGGNNGVPVTVSQHFGRSVEERFHNYDGEVEQKFEHVGRAIQNFYETFKFGAPLGIGGTVGEPEFYRMDIDTMRRAWRTDYQEISEIM